MADEMQQDSSLAPKRPMWQWIVLYLFIALVLYGLLYYFVFGKKTASTNQTALQPTPTATQIATPTTAASPSANASPTGTKTATVITVSGSEFAFTPSSITVKKGQPVQLTFKNTGQYPHNWTVSALGIKTPTVQSGQSTTITFTPTQTGSFTYICTVPGHADRGMKGTLIVQ